MTARTDRSQQVVASRERDRANDVLLVHTACYDGGPPIDGMIPNAARHSIAPIAGDDNFAG
jgi:hypothetical protein